MLALTQGLMSLDSVAPTLLVSTVGWSNPAASTTTQAVNIGSAPSAGDLIIIQLVTRPPNAGAITTPSGFTLLNQTDNSTNSRVSTFWKSASGSEGSTVNITTAISTSTVTAQTYKVPAAHWNNASAPEIQAATGVSAVPNCPLMSPSWGVSDNFIIASFGSRSDTVPTSYPYASGNTSTIGLSGSAGGSGTRMDAASCWDELSGASFDPAAFGTIVGGAGRAWIATTIAIRRP